MKRSHSTQEEPSAGIAGVRIAKVSDIEDPENLARVKLEFPWRDDDGESYWARIATNMTGDDYGTYFLPEVDDEVLVGFENGDIHNPVVIGSLWSGNRKPPEDNTEDNDIRTIKTRSGHRIEFDDDDSGKVTIETTGGHEIILDDDDDSVTIEDSGGNSIDMDAQGGEIDIEANTEISMSAPTIELDADAEITLSAGAKIDIDADGQAQLSGAMVDVESDGIMGIDATGPLTIDGAIVLIN